MTRHFKFLLSGLVMTMLFISCGSRQMFDNGTEHDPSCGFEDTGIEETLDQEENEVTKVSPAADRGNTFTASTEVSESTELATESNEVEEAVDNKKARKETTVGNKKRKKFKQVVNAVKEHKKKKRRGGGGASTILLVILAILIPPLAVGIYEGITGRFWLTLLLWLIGLGLGFWLLGPTLGWVCGLVAVILAILIVLGAW